MDKLNRAAKSPKGRELAGKARGIANDPKTREKLEGARGKLSGGVSAARQRLDRKRGNPDEPPAPPAHTPPPQPPPYEGGDGPKAA